MDLIVQSTMLNEISGKASRFPEVIRDLLSRAVGEITHEELVELLARHKSDEDNFDRTVEHNLRRLGPDLGIKRNHPVFEPKTGTNWLYFRYPGR